MAGHWLALYTFALFNRPADDPENDLFYSTEPAIWDAMECTEGFIARSGYEDEPGPGLWGEQVFPKYLKEDEEDWAPSTISLWRDLETALAAVYRGPHADFMRQAQHLFRDPVDYPSYVLWWVPEHHTPNWVEAVERHELLGDNGPSPEAFTFKTAFSPSGRPQTVQTDRTKQIAERNKLIATAHTRLQ